jgi:phospholipase C
MTNKRFPRDPRSPFNPVRRRFITGVAAAGGALALGGCSSDGGGGATADDSAALPTLPPPEDSGIDHIVQVMMENRSFDHYLGWVPGADGRQTGLKYPDSQGQLQDSFRLSQNPEYGYQGCGKADPNHNYDAGRVHLNGGAMDGWLLTDDTAKTPGDLFPIGYYTGEDLPFYAGVAGNYTICDRYFHGVLTSTFPNRMYIHAGATDFLANDLPIAQRDPSLLPTIWDRLAAKGRSAANYFFDLPTPGLWGTKYASILKPFPQFLLDAQAGTLPDVSYIDPFFGASVGEAGGISADDHPVADIRNGQAFLNQVYNALRASPQWERTLLVITYDEWGGFYDHVVPPMAPISPEEAAIGNDGRLGFRVPCCIIGPRARRGHVSKHQFDPNSLINLITWRFGLDPLSARADTSLNMAYALDFDSPANVDAPAFDVPVGPFGLPCAESALPYLPVKSLSPADRSRAEHYAELEDFRQLCLRHRLIRA